MRVKDLGNRVARVLAGVFTAGLLILGVGGNTTAEAAISLGVNQKGIQVDVDSDQKDQENYKMVIKKETDSGWASKTWDTYRTTMSWEDVLQGSKYIKRGDEVIMKIEANGGEKLETIRFRIGDTYRFGTSDGGNASSIAWNKSNSTSTGVEQKRTQKGDGTIITGWAQDQGHWYYLDPQYNGQMCYNGWKNINGSWYYFWGSGAMASNCWIKLLNNGETRWYFVNSKGEMATDTYVGNYHVNADGVWDYTR